MRVPARIIATEKLIREMDEAVYQTDQHVATLAGIGATPLCMPDGHSGYGFPIGGSPRWMWSKRHNLARRHWVRH